MLKRLFTLAGLVAAAVGVPAVAHHSAAQFDFTKPVTLQGVVKKIEVINPHTHILLSVTDKKGTRNVEYEGHSASNFFRAGYQRGAVEAGDKISITIAPMRDHSDGGFILSFTTKAGKKIGFQPI